MTMKSLLLTSITTLLLLAASNTDADEVTARITILETTDIHVHVIDYDYFQDRPAPGIGLVRTAGLIQRYRAAHPNSNIFLVDNGDLLQGNPLGDFIARERGLEPGDIHPVYKVMNQLDYTVGNIGNHEFNYGLEFLANSLAGANFPYISANVYHDDGDNIQENDKHYFKPYLITDRTIVADDGNEYDIRVGFIGFVPPQIMSWDQAHLKDNVIARDMVDAAREIVPQMKAEGADVIVAIPHSGLSVMTREGMEENATYYLSEVEGIDALMFGHSHRVFPSEGFADIDGVNLEAGTINGVPSTMPGAWGSHLGIVELDVTQNADGSWRRTGGMGFVQSIAPEGGDPIEPVPELVAAVADDHDAAIEYVRRAAGEITAPINSYFALVADDPSVQIVTDAQSRYVTRLIQGTEYDGMPVLSASAPFKSGGRGGADNYTIIEAGPIALKHVADLYIYPNTLRAVMINGAQVREWLEMSAGAFNQIDPSAADEQPLINSSFPSFNFDVIDGIEYQIDLTRPARYNPQGDLVHADSHRIVNMTYQGKPLDPEQAFVVATNNYRAAGGGSFPDMDGSSIIISAPDTNRDVVGAYILEYDKIDPSADGNWSFAPINDDVVVTFRSAARGAGYLPDNSPIELLREEPDGFGVYRIRF